MLNLEIISCLNDNYSYIIHDDTSDLVGVIDPSEYSPIDILLEKKYKKLDYILNTHHHLDHVGGNIELKKKYNSKIVGSKIDNRRIPEIDIMLDDGERFKFGSIDFITMLIPGHTNGHIAFYSELNKVLFTGDTLFSLGCGKVFEGTYKQMFDSLNRIKKLPKDTKIYCGHEYTRKNFDFCLKYEKNNKFLKKKFSWIEDRISKKLPTIPTSLQEELDTNIFLRCDNISVKNELKMSDSPEELIFEKLRNLKDEF
jgi:hydroxyacylglutathione hydrolase|tara:strand:+ start:249 stop:1013 length:765 start_codon:yes stop_codon:yes gene_type:complete